MFAKAKYKGMQIAAVLGMLLTAAIWGFAFTPQKTAAQYLGTFSLNGVRFIFGALIVWLFRWTWLKRKNFSKEEMRAGALLGLFLFGGATLQQFGLETTTAGKGGFITGLYLLFVPMFLRIFWKEATSPQLWVGVLLAVSGLYLLSVSHSFEVVGGDFLVLLCSIVFALHIIFIGLYAPNIEPLTLSIVQALTCGVLSLCLGIVVESPTLESVGAAWKELLYLGGLSVGVAYTIQVVAQRHLSSILVSFIASLEAIFAVLGGSIFLNEVLSNRQTFGCALMLAGIALAQLKLPKKAVTA